MQRPPLVDWFKGHPLAAAIISFFLPGIPHILMGEIALGIVAFLLTAACYYYYLGWVIAAFTAIHAYRVCESVYGRS